MKKLLSLALLVMLAFSCGKDNTNEVSNTAFQNDQNASDQRNCASHEVMLQQEAADPALAARHEEIENFIQDYVKNHAQDRSGSLVTIPVVFNVLYKTAAQNISAAQIQSQINVLNADYGATNGDYNNTPALFQGVRSGDIGIAFTLQNVVRKSTTKTSWTTNDAMKKSAQGGINPTDPANVLNIWVCNMGGGILGYAQFPGGPLATDGVVLDDNATGNTGTAAAPYGLGRTATHEVGHWLNLRHIWGDATCGSDLVSDTPTHNTSNGGCPAYPHYSTCSGTPVEMTMNYMDYTYDACMYMFTQGQKTRMQAVFAPGGPRYTFMY
ncbi:MAG: zinc metalloprotease [Saprospiraceae bacterium]|nr:zinc metalloprotease [Saprospiraceae bacterium]